jgi:hypothetical protein
MQGLMFKCRASSDRLPTAYDLCGGRDCRALVDSAENGSRPLLFGLCGNAADAMHSNPSDAVLISQSTPLGYHSRRQMHRQSGAKGRRREVETRRSSDFDSALCKLDVERDGAAPTDLALHDKAPRRHEQ